MSRIKDLSLFNANLSKLCNSSLRVGHEVPDVVVRSFPLYRCSAEMIEDISFVKELLYNPRVSSIQTPNNINDKHA